ncbi:MAG: PAS domain-containing protein, partial [Deltaproteobacteria bacterium]|nr:PAS domain-containing protein [Deltaproteobacteria bacterium]
MAWKPLSGEPPSSPRFFAFPMTFKTSFPVLSPHLSESSISLSDILNSLPFGVMVLDHSGNILDSNRLVAKFLGVEFHNLLNQEISKFFPLSFQEILASVSGGGQAAGIVPRELKNCYIQISPLNGTLATVTFIEENLFQSDLMTNTCVDPLIVYHKQIFENSANGISIVDKDKRVLLMNDAAARLFDTIREDIQGKPISFFVDNKILSDSITQDVLASGKTVSRLVKQCRTGKHILLTGTPIFSPDGEAALVIVNERDLTELLELQSSLQQQKITINFY